MCFSTTVSFTTGAALIAVSIYTIYKARTRNKKYTLFACMPLFFGIQQIIEGFVWLGKLGNNPFLLKISSLGFIFFAFAFWPVFSPLSMYFIEEKKEFKRKKLLLILFALSLLIGAAIYLPIILNMVPLNTKVVCNSISYDVPITMAFTNVYTLIYLLITISPFLIVPNIKLRIFAILLLFSSLISNYFYTNRFISVWCFFAAILSFFIIYIMYKLPKNRFNHPPHLHAKNQQHLS